MIPNTRDRELESSVSESHEFGISARDTAHVMSILRDAIYSDKVLAVLREYGSNAWDAHRAAGKADLPISVTLPTAMEPTLSIRDYGGGLSRDDVLNVFTQYGASTKRGSDDQVGMLGIGSKAGFSYADTFTITTWNGGQKCVFVAVLDKSEKGLIKLMHEEPCGDETGVQIQIAVRQEDIGEFERKAIELFKHFMPRPKINVELPEISQKIAALRNGHLFSNFDVKYEDRGWLAVMGCVPYRVQTRQLIDQDIGLPPYMEKISGVLYFDIGEVQINASREELKYNATTKKAIVQKITGLVDEYVERTLGEIMTDARAPWDRRLKLQAFKRLGLLAPPSVKEFTDDFVKIGGPGVPVTFQFTTMKRDVAAGQIAVLDSTRIVLKDDNRTLKGYGLSTYDIIVRKGPKVSWTKVRVDLDKFLADKGLTGIPIVQVSTLPWTVPYSRGGGTRGAAVHKQNLMVFRLAEPTRVVKSARWEAVDGRTPTADDVWVVLERFDAADYNFYTHYTHDKTVFDGLGKTMPPIYGYRSTEKRQVKTDGIPGVPYREWCKTIQASLYAENKDVIERVAWVSVFEDCTNLRAMKGLATTFGVGHPIADTLYAYLRALDEHGALGHNAGLAIKSLFAQRDVTKYPDTSMAPAMALLHLKSRYPLLFLGEDMYKLWGTHSKEWIKYVGLVDNAEFTVP